VDFKIGNCCTNTRHTVTMLIKPEGSLADIDQDSSQRGTLSTTFDVPGVYVLICKIHPYMTAVVAVTDAEGNIPDVTAGSLPFLGHLGVSALPALDVLGVITTVAATDEDKLAKWDILGPEDEFRPAIPGVGEIWVNSQFERVPNQTDDHDVLKPGTITVVDAATMTVEREINGLDADGMWNNPHNMWADFSLGTIYNTNWFGKWVNKIDRESGQILDSLKVGEAPTHVITIPVPGSPQLGWLTIPLSADRDLVKVEDTPDGLRKMDADPTGDGETNPHGHWLTCGTGDRAIVANVFKGLGPFGSISVLDTESGDVLAEFEYDADDPIRSALLMPLAVGECHVDGVNTAYVANAVSGFVTVLNVDDLELITNIPVTLTPDGQSSLDLFNTLQVPIQTPVSPDEKWVATAVLSLTTVPTITTGSPDHVALIDTSTNEVVKYIATPAGTHGVNWGAKLGGGYYAYVTSQHANVLCVIDPDPDFDGDGSDAAVVGMILLANGSPGAGVTDGTGGQGVKPIPLTHDGWVQKTVALAEAGGTSQEVADWISLLTEDQKNPESHHEGLHLAIDPLVGGTTSVFEAEGGVPGQPVFFVFSLVGTGAGPCFDVLGGLCLDLLAPFQFLAGPLADASGHVSFSVAIPTGLPPVVVDFQTVVQNGLGGASSFKSNVVSLAVQ
jgi:DNA-binding beta-propeller fold protein YncE